MKCLLLFISDHQTLVKKNLWHIVKTTSSQHVIYYYVIVRKNMSAFMLTCFPWAIEPCKQIFFFVWFFHPSSGSNGPSWCLLLTWNENLGRWKTRRYCGTAHFFHHGLNHFSLAKRYNTWHWITFCVLLKGLVLLILSRNNFFFQVHSKQSW